MITFDTFVRVDENMCVVFMVKYGCVCKSVVFFFSKPAVFWDFFIMGSQFFLRYATNGSSKTRTCHSEPSTAVSCEQVLSNGNNKGGINTAVSKNQHLACTLCWHFYMLYVQDTNWSLIWCYDIPYRGTQYIWGETPPLFSSAFMHWMFSEERSTLVDTR